MTLIRLPEPLVVHGQRRYRVLTEDDFVEYAVRQGLPREWLRRDFGVPNCVYTTSLQHYGAKYATQLQQLKHARYATAALGNTRGRKKQPEVVLDEAQLRAAAKAGKNLRVMAELFGVSTWYVRQNLRYYGLSLEGRQGGRTQRLEDEYVTLLELFSPGFTVASARYYDNPHEFFKALYVAYLRVTELLYVIKEQGAGLAHFHTTGKVPRDHISFSLNKHELILSRALLNAGLNHRRLLAFDGYVADFGFEAEKVLVEVDGPMHVIDAKTKARDRKKETAARRMGYTTLRFTTVQVEEEIQWVLTKIKELLKERSGK